MSSSRFYAVRGEGWFSQIVWFSTDPKVLWLHDDVRGVVRAGEGWGVHSPTSGHHDAVRFLNSPSRKNQTYVMEAFGIDLRGLKPGEYMVFDLQDVTESVD